MAYDPPDGGVVLFGGSAIPSQGGATVYGDTWFYVNGQWINLTGQLPTSPSPRTNAAMVYDPVDGYVLLFGGAGGTNAAVPLNDTWEFHNMRWTELSPARAPPPLRQPAVTYDEIDGYVLMFGGATGPSSTLWIDQTWTFVGGDWTEVATTGPVPTARNAAGLAYDPVEGYSVLFGGWNGIDRFNDTWAYRDGSWTELVEPTAPSPRLIGALTFDPELNAIVLFGGEYVGQFYADTWTFSGGLWSDLTAVVNGTPFNRSAEAMTYLPDSRSLLMFGGETFFPATLNDTWVFAAIATPSPPAMVASDFLPGLVIGAMFGALASAGVAYVWIHRRDRVVQAK